MALMPPAREASAKCGRNPAAQFGSDLDATTQKLLNRGARLTELLKQPQFSPLKTEEQVAVIFAGVNGYLDDRPVGAVREFEAGLLRFLRADHDELLSAIREKKALDADMTDKLKAALDAYVKTLG